MFEVLSSIPSPNIGRGGEEEEKGEEEVEREITVTK